MVLELKIELTFETPAAWTAAVINDFDTFLQDHADCERKASAMAMSFVAKCPDKVEIIPDLIDTAVEELEHFRMVYRLMEERGVHLKKEITQDLYINNLIKHCRSGSLDRLLDRFIIASLVEYRGAERFRLVSEALQDENLKKFYRKLYISEARHGNIFIEMAKKYWDSKEIEERIGYLCKTEGEICSKLEYRAALH